jgi:hypothetical protein
MVKIKLYRYELYRFNKQYCYEKIYQSFNLQNALKELDKILRIRAKSEEFQHYEDFMARLEDRVRSHQEDCQLDESFLTDKNCFWNIHSGTNWQKPKERHHEIETGVDVAGKLTGRWMLNVTRL